MAHLFQINTSPGGLPKLPRQSAFVRGEAVEGDGHNYKGHGGPDAAVCLYSLECITTLQAEGNPVFPGALGENFTITGLDWDAMVVGARLKVGNVLVLEITSFATPCSKLEPYLTDIWRVSQKEHPGWGRPYCKIITAGIVTIGDTVEIIA